MDKVKFYIGDLIRIDMDFQDGKDIESDYGIIIDSYISNFDEIRYYTVYWLNNNDKAGPDGTITTERETEELILVRKM